MTAIATQFSDLLAGAAERADRGLVHVAGPCRGGASGSVFSSEGVIVTTARALRGRQRVEVVRGDESFEARLVGLDAATDLAVLSADAPLEGAPGFADVPLRLGMLALIASRPGRAVRVRLGVVSQVGEGWHTPLGGRVESYVALDATPEPGFSGGLAFDVEGRALGVTSAGLLRGAPLVIEKRTLDRVVGSLLTHGRVKRGYLGVGTQAVRLPEELAQRRAQRWGLLVASVQPNSAAERAGLMLGDVLLGFGAHLLVGAGALQAALEDAEDQTTALALWRAGQEMSVDVTPGARP